MGSGAAITRLKTCCWASVEALIAERRAAKSTDSAWRSPPLRGVPNLGRAIASRAARIASSGSDFAPLRRAARLGRSNSMTMSDISNRYRLRPAPVATCPLDRPGPQHRVVVGEVHQLGIALWCRIDGDLVEDPTRRGVESRRGVGMDVGVDANHDTDHVAEIGQTVHAFSP